MRRLSKKELRGYVADGLAVDITEYNHAAAIDLWRRCDFDKIGYCSGSYGISGGLVQDRKTGIMYAILARTVALLTIF